MHILFSRIVTTLIVLLSAIVPACVRITQQETPLPPPLNQPQVEAYPVCNDTITMGQGSFCSIWNVNGLGVRLHIAEAMPPSIFVAYELYDPNTNTYLGQMKSESAPEAGQTLILPVTGESGFITVGITRGDGGQYTLSGLRVSGDFRPIGDAACVRKAPVVMFESGLTILGHTQAGKTVVLIIDRSVNIEVWESGADDKVAADIPLPYAGATAKIEGTVDGQKFAVRIFGCGNAYGIYQTDPPPPTPNPERKDPAEQLQGSLVSFPG